MNTTLLTLPYTVISKIFLIGAKDRHELVNCIDEQKVSSLLLGFVTYGALSIALGSSIRILTKIQNNRESEVMFPNSNYNSNLKNIYPHSHSPWKTLVIGRIHKFISS
jgi:hypothetical protein